jgi:UDP-N-acetylglucosamine/UDP-N-acetylgalactosamine diphosphorylase
MKETIMELGVQALRNGEVAVVVMAGGQGSRLRAPVPKAMMELLTPSKMTLLEVQLRRVRKLERLYVIKKGIPVYILTSESTHSPISAYLMANDNFGVAHVVLVKQRQLPARFESGELCLADKGRVLAAPNGNGSIFQELRESGALAEMMRHGVKYIDIHPIDNALARPADPMLACAMVHEGGDVGVKVLKKLPKEKIGTLCKRAGKTVVIEYSEIPPGEEEAYKYGNSALHMYTVDLVDKAADAELPYHIAKKQEKILDHEGNQVMGDVRKFERFIFDAFEYAEKVVLVDAVREEEFAPIKNSSGAPVDSPETARDLLLNLHRKWATDAGMILEGSGPLEFLPETTYAGEGIAALAGKKVKLPGQI